MRQFPHQNNLKIQLKLGQFLQVLVMILCLTDELRGLMKTPNSSLFMVLPSYQAILGENFSQSEYVTFGGISQFAFPPLAKAIHRAFDYVNLSHLCSKQAFHSINLSNVGFIIDSQSVRIHISFRQKPINKLRFEAENSTDPYAFAGID